VLSTSGPSDQDFVIMLNCWTVNELTSQNFKSKS